MLGTREKQRRSVNRSRGMPGAEVVLEPTAAVREPPAEDADGNRGEERPPERQEEVAGQAEHDEACPEDLLLQTRILAQPATGPGIPHARAAEEILGSPRIVDKGVLAR